MDNKLSFDFADFCLLLYFHTTTMVVVGVKALALCFIPLPTPKNAPHAPSADSIQRKPPMFLDDPTSFSGSASELGLSALSICHSAQSPVGWSGLVQLVLSGG